MDMKTLLDRTNDAINTIIRLDETTETGEFLQPCIEGIQYNLYIRAFGDYWLRSMSKSCLLCSCIAFGVHTKESFKEPTEH